MIYAVANHPFEALAAGAPIGLVGQITVEVFDPTDGSTIIPAQTSGITEPRPGTYVATLEVGTVGGYAVMWTLPGGDTAVEELAVAVDGIPLPPAPITTGGWAPLDEPVYPGAHYFTLEELRAEQDIPEAQYPDDAVEPNRDLAEQVLEQSSGEAFLPRWRIERLRPLDSGHYRLAAPLVRGLAAVTVDGEPWTGAVTLDGNYLTGVYGDDVVVTYAHGYDFPPARVRRAAMIATRIWTTRGPVDDRATQLASDGATINLATPGQRGSVTGIPEVDAVIDSFWRPGRLY